MKNKIARLLFIGFTVLTVLLVCFIGFLTVTHTKAYAVQSNSMSPAINKGDAIFIRSVKTEDLRSGTIVTVRTNDASGVFTHRITRVDTQNSLIYTKGDNNVDEDPMPSEISNIIGRILFRIPYIGSISLAVQNKTFVILIASAAIILISASAVLSRKKAKDGGGKNAA